MSLTIRSQRVLPDAYVETHWFNGIGEPYALTKTSAKLGRGQTALSLRVPPHAQAHTNTACFIVRDAAGASLAWGFTSVDLAAPTWLTQLRLEPDTLVPQGGVWQEDGTVEKVKLRDSIGRLAEKSANTSLQKAQASRPSSQPSTSCCPLAASLPHDFGLACGRSFGDTSFWRGRVRCN